MVTDVNRGKVGMWYINMVTDITKTNWIVQTDHITDEHSTPGNSSQTTHSLVSLSWYRHKMCLG